MTLTPEMLLIVCPLALLAGFIDAIAGGGGMISLPAYYLAGLPPALASGTFVTTVTDVVGFFSFLGFAGIILL